MSFWIAVVLAFGRARSARGCRNARQGYYVGVLAGGCAAPCCCSCAHVLGLSRAPTLVRLSGRV
eukprot:13965846-Alexandrium_andersonii.AAC.1